MYKQRRQKQEAGNGCEILNSSNQSPCLNDELCGVMNYDEGGIGPLNCLIKIGDRGVDTTGFEPGILGQKCTVNTRGDDGNRSATFQGKWISTTVGTPLPGSELKCELN